MFFKFVLSIRVRTAQGIILNHRGHLRYYVTDIDGHNPVWRDTDLLSHSSSKLLRFTSDDYTFQLIAYVSKYPKGHSCVRWSVDDIAGECMRADRDGRWLTHKMSEFGSRVLGMGFDRDHLRRSQASVKASFACRSPLRLRLPPH